MSTLTKKAKAAQKSSTGVSRAHPVRHQWSTSQKNGGNVKKAKKPSTWNAALLLRCLDAMGFPKPEQEYRFHPVRKWRADFAWPDQKVILEIEGGAYTNGRHTRGSGFVNDIEKYNAAGALGYRVIRAVPQWVPGRYGLKMNPDLVETLSAVLGVDV